VKITSIGGGPGGLYAAILLKRADPGADVTVFERNAPDDTFGFGVVFSEATLGELADADLRSYEALMDACARWDPVEVRYGGERIRAGGNRFAAVSRHRLLNLLQHRAAELGVDVRFQSEVDDIDAVVADADLVIAADGINSAVRARYAAAFGPSLTPEGCTFIWLGTPKVFDAFTFIFLETPYGLFQAHVYPFSDDRSTFIVECSLDTWRAAGLDAVDAGDLPPGVNDEKSIAFLEDLFADHLDGRGLIGNNSKWLDWRTVRNRRWRHENVVVIGDAAHTAHFSIGSGTKLALEDAIALARSLERADDLETALRWYEGDRRPAVERVQAAAAESLDWFGRYRRYWGFAAPQFTYQLLSRSARVDHDNLKRRDPGLVLAVDRWFAERSGLPRPSLVPPPPALTPFRLRDLEVASRVVLVAGAVPAVQDGRPPEAVRQEVAVLGRGGAGLVLLDHVAVAPDARTTPEDLGLWDDEQASTFGDLATATGAAPLGIVLTHAGPRGATRPRREGADRPLRRGGWPLVAASPIPYTASAPPPQALDGAAMDAIREAFAAAARRAGATGAALLGVDMGHGRLLASFLSPLTNRRDDEYGGDVAGRLRFPLAVLEAVRGVWPEDRPLLVRLTADDRHPGGISPEDVVTIARELRDRGADLVDVVSGQTVAHDRPEYDGAYNAPLADLVRNEAGVPTLVGGGITALGGIDHLVVGGVADLCILRPVPPDPAWLDRAR
jgi:anthraniloyl-CoA monooxygenase